MTKSFLIVTVTGSDANCKWLSIECEKGTSFKNPGLNQYAFARYAGIVAKKDKYPGVETSFLSWDALTKSGFEIGTKPVPEAPHNIIDFLLEYGYMSESTDDLDFATDLFKCSRCGKGKCKCKLRSRAADEAMTVLIKCLVCNKEWIQ